MKKLWAKVRSVAALAAIVIGFASCSDSNFLGTESRIKPVSNDTNVPLVNAKVTIGKIEWYKDYADALAASNKQNKPIWLHFGENPG